MSEQIRHDGAFGSIVMCLPFSQVFLSLSKDIPSSQVHVYPADVGRQNVLHGPRPLFGAHALDTKNGNYVLSLYFQDTFNLKGMLQFTSINLYKQITLFRQYYCSHII